MDTETFYQVLICALTSTVLVFGFVIWKLLSCGAEYDEQLRQDHE